MSNPLVNVEILPATEEDTLALAQIESAAFQGSDPRLGAVLFGPPTPQGHERRSKDLIGVMNNDPTVKFTKAVVDGQIAAWAEWHYYAEPFSPKEWEDKEFPDFTSPAGCNEFFGLIQKRKNKHLAGSRFAYLQILVTDPKYQRLGLGSKLMQHGLEEADKAGMPGWLEASANGYALYKKFGFMDVDEIVIDLSKYGGEGTWRNTCMLRPIKV